MSFVSLTRPDKIASHQKSLSVLKCGDEGKEQNLNFNGVHQYLWLKYYFEELLFYSNPLSSSSNLYAGGINIMARERGLKFMWWIYIVPDCT